MMTTSAPDAASLRATASPTPLLPPVTMENVDIVMNEVPELGQHTDAILDEFGFDRATIASWRAQKII